MNESTDAELNLDFRYFKYRAINKHLIESLVSSRLYFPTRDKLNDPLDCRLDLRESIARAAKSATGKRRIWLQSALDHGREFIENWEKSFENFGICSFSLDLDTPPSASVLWSHYADEHRGVCLLYRFPESFLNDKRNTFGVDKVRYDDDALTDWLRHEAPMELKQFVIELAKIYLTAKSPAWKYENEARIIRQEHGFLDIPVGFLAQVCFGLRTPPADIALVQELARDHSGCEMFCRIIRDKTTDFGIKAVEM